MEEGAIVVHHLFRGERADGVWLRLRAACDVRAINRAAEELRDRKRTVVMAEQASDVAGETAQERIVEAAKE